MPNVATAELYFISLMMFLIIVICIAATFFFFRQYKREMKAKEEAKILKAKQAKAKEQSPETT